MKILNIIPVPTLTLLHPNGSKEKMKSKPTDGINFQYLQQNMRLVHIRKLEIILNTVIRHLQADKVIQ